MHDVPHILVADNDYAIRRMLEIGLSLNGFDVTSVRSAYEALRLAKAGEFGAVLTDSFMPGASGMDILDELRVTRPKIPIVLMTARGSVETAFEAMSRGAADFIGKPFDIAMVVQTLRRCLDAGRETAVLEPAVLAPDVRSASGLVGRSAPMALVYKFVAQAARADATVLIVGESGTGKELVARGIHDYSCRRSKPFVAVNCSGLTDTLLEAELFGHIRGAFTGAACDRPGLFEAADGGTLFLDELGSTSSMFQASLLRVLQTSEVPRVGSTQHRTVNVRVVAASNAPLSELVRAGEFRADLFYRLSVLAIELPPLRERRGDVPLLAAHFLHRFRNRSPINPRLTREALEALMSYSFPGNIRELENALRRAVAMSANGLITLDCLPPEIGAPSNGVSRQDTVPSIQSLIWDWPSMDELQRLYLQMVLLKSGGNRRRAAGVLNIERRTVQRLMARYRL
jgi:DNA-binding NtrC family response regulator